MENANRPRSLSDNLVQTFTDAFLGKNRYVRVIRWFAFFIVMTMVFGQVFDAVSDDIFNAEQQESVLVLAVPFVANFVALLLVYILLIVLVAMRYSKKLPRRVQLPIEYLSIVGILVGAVSMFQPLEIFGYEYGFILLLGSTLTYILWSHITPRRVDAELKLEPLTVTHHVIGVVLGLVVVAMITVVVADLVEPEAPYGFSDRRWTQLQRACDRGSERFCEDIDLAKSEAEDDFVGVQIPFLAFFSLFPGAVVYILARELAATFLSSRDVETPQNTHELKLSTEKG